MQETTVHFYSEGLKLAGIWRTPDQVDGPLPAIVQGPGWLGLKDAKLYLRYHTALTEAGFGVLIFDYRGFGDSEGDDFSIAGQTLDLTNAVSYLASRDDVDADRIGAFGSGGTGGANAIMLAGADPRVRAAVSQVPVADGEDWLHRMRSEYDWIDFLNGLEEDRQLRASTGEGRKVHPREEIMIPTAERRKTNIKKDVDSRIPESVSLSAADEILSYRPIDVASRLKTPLMIIGVEGDATTPTDHAVALYEAAQGPKELLMQRHTTHYAAYERYGDVVTPRIVAWFQTYVAAGDVAVRSTDAQGLETTTNILHPAPDGEDG